jgi:hypothetical protein
VFAQQVQGPEFISQYCKNNSNNTICSVKDNQVVRAASPSVTFMWYFSFMEQIFTDYALWIKYFLVAEKQQQMK